MTGSDGCDETPRPPASIDTDICSFSQKVERAAPGEPFMIDVALRAVTVRRIDLEREDGETFCEWIRTAVDGRLELTKHGDVSKGDEPPRSRPADYTPTYDTPDEEIIAETSKADLDEWLSITVEFPAGVLTALLEDCREQGDVGEWIRSATRIYLSQLEREHVLRPTVSVDVPAEIAQRARLRAEYGAIHNESKDYQAALIDALFQLVEPQTEFTVDGTVLVSFDHSDCNEGSR